jgi:hypothetical protein
MIKKSLLNHLLFFHYTTFVILYAIANGWLFSAKSIITMIIPMIFIVYAVWANIEYNKYFRNTRMIYLYMLYILILVFFSSDILYSLKNVLKSFVPFLYFGLGVSFIHTYKDLNKLFKSLMILGALYLANLVVANLLNLGGGQYAENEVLFIQTGSIYSEGLNSMAYYLLLLPAIIKIYPFKEKRSKLMFIISAVIILITLILILKRGALAVVITGYVVAFLTSSLRMKGRILKISFITFLILLFSYPVYKDMLLSRMEVRKERLQTDTYETEARYLENFVVIDEILLSGNIAWFFFGHDVLNSPGNYADGAFGDRQLHNDYAQILHGSGVIGLSLFIFLNLSILSYYLRLRKKLIQMNLFGANEKLLHSAFFAFFAAFFILSTSGSIGSLLYEVIRYVFLGAVIGLFRNKIHSAINPESNIQKVQSAD